MTFQSFSAVKTLKSKGNIVTKSLAQWKPMHPKKDAVSLQNPTKLCTLKNFFKPSSFWGQILSECSGFHNFVCTLLERLNHSLCFILWGVGKVYIQVVKGFTASATWAGPVTTAASYLDHSSPPRFQIKAKGQYRLKRKHKSQTVDSKCFGLRSYMH